MSQLLIFSARDVLRELAPVVDELHTAQREGGGYDPKRLGDLAHAVELGMVRMPETADLVIDDKLFILFEALGQFVGRAAGYDSRGTTAALVLDDEQDLCRAYNALLLLLPGALDKIVHRPFHALRPSALAG